MLSPHTSVLQSGLQPSPCFPFPSSHCSSGSTVPFPQYGRAGGGSRLQTSEQPSPIAVLPSSHCSLCCTIWSPQRGLRHAFVQASLLTVLSSSHCSGEVVLPSPHVAFALSQLIMSKESMGDTYPSLFVSRYGGPAGAVPEPTVSR